MSDATLIAFGCGVSFIAFAGVYVYVRESFLASERRRSAQAADQGNEGENVSAVQHGTASSAA